VSGTSLICGNPLHISDTATAGALNDKEYVAYDPANNRVYVTWTLFDASGGSVLKLRYYDVAMGTLSQTYDLTSINSQGTYPVVTSSGLVYVFFEGNPAASNPAIDYVTFNNGTISSVQTLASINPATTNSACNEEAFTTEAFDTGHAARVLEFPTAVVDASGNIDVTWNAAPTSGADSAIYVATLTANSSTPSVQTLPNPNGLIQWQPSPAVAGNTLVVTYYQVVKTSAGYQLERDMNDATAGTTPSFGAAFPISARSFAADQTNPNFDPPVNGCYMGDYSSSLGSGTAIYSVWGDNRNSTKTSSGTGPQPDIYGAVYHAWTSQSPLPDPDGSGPASGNTEGACTAAINGKIYVAYGYDSSFGDTSFLRIYDVNTNTWSLGPAAPLPMRSEGYRGVALGGKLYCMGGRFGGALSDVDSFDPVSNTWTTLASMPDGRAGMTAVAWNGSIYTFGGRAGTAPCNGPTATNNTIRRYDPSTNTWSNAGNLVVKRSDATAAVVGDKIYIFGGCDDTGAFFDSVEVYNPHNQTSTLLSVKLPGGVRADAAAVAVGNAIHITGGWNSSGPLSANHVVYYVDANILTAGLTLPTHCSPGQDRAELELVNSAGVLYAVGGSCPAFGASINNLDALQL